jgi:hypothetical protein
MHVSSLDFSSFSVFGFNSVFYVPIFYAHVLRFFPPVSLEYTRLVFTYMWFSADLFVLDSCRKPELAP